MLRVALLILLFWLSIACKNVSTNKHSLQAVKDGYEKVEIYEFKRGDIIVKPNLSFLPGSSFIKTGFGFGHAAIVTRGYRHKNLDSLLAGTIIIESMARDVPQPFQVREIAAHIETEKLLSSCTSFSKKYHGNLYRLRLNFRESTIDSIIAFSMQQKGDLSCWNATKRFPEYPVSENANGSWADNSQWYCSLLIWQSVFYVSGQDLDVNQGFQVYPNDLINHPVFDGKIKGQAARMRF